MNKIKVVASVDTNCTEDIIQSMIMNGIDAIKINMDNTSRADARKIIEIIRYVNNKMNTFVGIMLEIGEQSLHLGKIKDGQAYFKVGDRIRIYTEEVLGDETKASINKNIIDEVSRDDNIFIGEEVKLKVYDKGDNYIICEVLNGGNIVNYANVHIKNSKNTPFLKVKDIKNIEFASQMHADFIKLPMVKSSEDVLEVTDMLIELKNDHTAVITNIDNASALDDIDNIMKMSDGVIIDRNNISMDIPLERIPGIQKTIINKCLRLGKISIVSIDLPNSLNRVEVIDITNAALDGVDALIINEVIKEKTNSTKLLKSILTEIEKTLDYNNMCEFATRNESNDITGMIASNVALTANRLKCKAIIAPTITGYTARKISRYRTNSLIIAVSPSLETVTALSLNFGVVPVLIDDLNSLEKIIKVSESITKSIITLEHGDKIIITGGYPFKESKNTNFMKIEEI